MTGTLRDVNRPRREFRGCMLVAAICSLCLLLISLMPGYVPPVVRSLALAFFSTVGLSSVLCLLVVRRP